MRQTYGGFLGELPKEVKVKGGKNHYGSWR